MVCLLKSGGPTCKSDDNGTGGRCTTPKESTHAMLPVAVLGAVELMILDKTAPLYLRCFAFHKLLKVWTGSRFSDLTGLSPSSITLSGYGLEGMLDRTKTSGPSKRVIFLPIFISCDALASGWLAEGWELWQNSTMAFTRDYFLPLPNADFSGARPTMADYPQTVVLTKKLWRSLKVPVLTHSGWELSADFMFDTADPLRYWKEHSERNWLVSMLAALGVPPDEREFVGRWQVKCGSLQMSISGLLAAR